MPSLDRFEDTCEVVALVCALLVMTYVLVEIGRLWLS